MSRRLPILAVVILTACDSPSPYFMSGEQTEVVIDGSTFSVHRQGSLVEVYRTSFEWRPHLSVVLARAELAIRQATGCPVRQGSMQGDHALIRAQLDCAGTLPPVPPSRPVRYECVIMGGSLPDGRAPYYEELDCTPVSG